MKDYKILLKNNYLYNRENSLINILQYLIVEKEEKKYLLLQLNNNFKYAVKALEMLVVQLDENGDPICTSKFECKDINVRSGKTFIPEVFIELNDNCKDIKADLIEARFNKYIYQNDKINRLIDKKKKPVSESNDKLKIFKKKVKKPKFLLVPVLVLFILAAVLSFIGVKIFSYKKYTFTLEDYEYAFVSNDNSKDADIIITKYNGTDSNISIPDMLMNHDIVAIGREAFANNKYISKIKFEGSIEKIEKNAFKNCSNLVEVNLNRISEIKSSAFEGCSKLEKVNLKKINVLESRAFKDCVSLKSAIIQNDEGSALIQDNIFYNCTSLSEVQINITSTEGYMNLLSGCYNIESLRMKNLSVDGRTYTLKEVFGLELSNIKLKSLYVDAIDVVPANFAENFNLEEITIKKIASNIINDYAFNNCKKLNIFNIPNTIQEIGKFAFARTKINSINFPNLVKIDDAAFSNCTALNEIILSDATTHFGSGAFEKCTSLKTITLPDTTVSIGETIFKDCTGLIEIRSPFIGSTSNELKNLSYLFGDTKNVSLKKVTLTKQTAISENMFLASKIEEVIAYEATEIRNSAFKDCSYIKIINLPKVTLIKDSAFENCLSLEIASFSSELSNIGTKAFLNCAKLVQLSDTSKLKYLGISTFENCASLEKIDLSSVEIITPSVFKKCAKLKDITYSENLIEIKSNAFEGCIAMDFDFPSSLRNIGDYAFKDCVQLKEFVIEDNVLYIGKGIFNGCTLLTNITTPFIGYSINSLEKIEYLYEDGLHQNITDLTLTLQTRLGDYAFENANKLVNITIPNVVEIGNYSFSYCTSIKTFTLNDKLTSVGTYVFSNCTSLEKVVLPNTITYISMGMFENCFKLKEIEISKNISTIGDYAFYNCSSLEAINLHNNIISIGKYAFAFCNGISTMNIPNSVQTIGVAIFNGCTNLKTIKIPFVGENIENLKSMDYLYGEISTFSNEGTFNLSEITLTVQNIILDHMFENTLIEVVNMTELESIGEYAFNNCIKLRKLPSLEKITEIKPYTFAYCSSMQAIDATNATIVGDSAFVGCASLKLIGLLEKVSEVGKASFSGCVALESITIPNVETIGEEAFYNCSLLKTISSLNKLTKIEKSAFGYCRNISNINIPNVTSIGDYAFSDCSKIREITLSANIVDMGTGAFMNCSTISNFTIPSGISSIGENVLSGCNSLLKFETPFIGESSDNLKDISYIFGSSVPLSLNELVINNQETFADYSFANTNIDTIRTPKATTFGSYVFQNCLNLVNYVLPVTVTSIGNNVFDGCVNLNELTIGNQVTSIGDNIVNECTSLQKITIPFIGSDINTPEQVSYLYGESSLSNLDEMKVTLQENFVDYSFANSNLSSISFDNALTFGTYAFYNCANLDDINLGSRLTEISSSAFYDCINLKEIEIPLTVVSLGDSVFKNCSALTELVIPDTVMSMGENVLSGCSSLIKLTTPYIGKSSTELYTISDLFEDNCNLEEVIINVQTSTNENQFANLITLKSASIANVLSIDASSFKGCSSLENIELSEDLDVINSNAFEGCTSLAAIEIPSAVTYLGDEAFKNCSALTELVIPDSVTSMGNAILSGCNLITKLTTPYIGKTNTELYSFDSLFDKDSIIEELNITSQTFTIAHQFEYIYTLKSVCIPEVLSIEARTFRGCSALESIEFSENLDSIYSYAFDGCSSLTELEIPETVTAIGFEILQNCGSLTKLTIPFVGYAIDDLQSLSSILSDYNIKLEELTLTCQENIVDYQFNNVDSLKTVNIPCVKSIGSYAFSNSDSLQTIEFTDNLETINTYAFQRCYSLTNVSFPESLKTISSYAFYDCGLEEVTFSEGLETIESSAFYSCDSLEEIEFPESLIEIGAYSFAYCSNLGSVSISEGLESIGSYAFEYCNNLEEMIIPDSVVTMNDGLFYGCSALKKLKTPFVGYNVDDTYTLSALFGWSSINLEDLEITKQTFISNSQFSNRDSLKTVKIPSVKTINDYGFYWCSNIKTIEFGEELESIGSYAFNGCSSLTELTIPDSVTSLGYSILGYTSSLSELTIPFVGYAVDDLYSMLSLFNWSEIKLTELTVTKQEYTLSSQFSGMKLLESVSMPSVTNIASYSFQNCIMLEEATFSEDLTTINSYAFYDCSSLLKFVVDEDVTTINDSAFYGCTSLYEVYDYSSLNITEGDTNNGYVGYYAFAVYNSPSDERIPKLITDNYLLALKNESWYLVAIRNKKLENYELPSDLTYNEETITYSLLDSLFASNKSIKTITIPACVTDLGTHTFEECENLEKIEFDSSINIETIGYNLFYNCENLSEVIIPESVISIGSYAFYGCDSLREITISDNIENIEYGAFDSCDYLYEVFNLGELSITRGSTDYGYVAYNALAVYNSLDSERLSIEDIDGLKYVAVDDELLLLGFADDSETDSIVFPNSVEHNGTVYDTYKIYKNAFNDCTTLTSIEFSDSISEIGNYAFYNCYNISNVKMGDNITKIGDYAFYNCYNANGLELTESIESIGSYAFGYCNSIKVLRLYENLIEIKDGAFTNCSSLKYILNVNNTKLEYLGSYAFYNCYNLVYAEFGGTFTEIKYNTFEYCNKLQRINLPDTISKISGYAFRGCSKLNYFVIGSSVTMIDYNAFYSCSSLSSVFNYSDLSITVGSFDNGRVGYYATNIYNDATEYLESFAFESGDFLFFYNGEELVLDQYFGDETDISLPTDISYNGSSFSSYKISNGLFSSKSITSINIPKEVTEIGDNVFNYCYNLSTVTFDEDSQLQIIGDSAFYNCGSLRSITIPASVTSIGSYAFAFSSYLNDVKFEENSELETINDYAFYDCYYSGEDAQITIPASVKTIGNSSFASCDVLKELIFEEDSQLETIGTYAFQYTYYLEEVIIPASVVSIPLGCFQSSGIKSLNFVEGSSLESIEQEAFYSCYSLEKVELPASLKTISTNAFGSCSSLKEVIFEENSELETIGRQAFISSGIETIIFPASLITIESEAFMYSLLQEINFEENSELETIGSKAFGSLSNLQKIYLPANLKSIETSAFEYCYSVDEITFEENSELETIADYAFINVAYNTSLDIELPSSLTAIGMYAFYESGVKNVILPSSLLSIGEYAFSNCAKLESVEFEENSQLLSIDNYAFSNSGKDNGLSMSLPSSVQTIESYAFYESGLNDINIPASLNSMGQYAFAYCHNLSEVKADENCLLTNIPEYAFYYAGIEETMNVSLPQELIAIGASAFYGAEINTIIIPASVRSISDYSFYDIPVLTSVQFDENSQLELIGEYAFYNSGITEIVIPASVNTIGQYAFANNISLAALSFEENSNLEVIEQNTFENVLIGQLDLPANLKTIKINAFKGNNNLFKVILNPSLSAIQAGAFDDCNNIYIIFKNGCQIQLASGMTDYGSLAKNAKIIKEGAPEPGVNYTIKESDNYRFIIEEGGEVTAYLINYDILDDSNSIIIPDEIELDGENLESIVICPYAFAANSNIYDVYISKLVKEINKNAFANLDKLETIYFDGTSDEWDQIKSNDDNYDSYNIIFEEEVIEEGDEVVDDSNTASDPNNQGNVEL